MNQMKRKDKKNPKIAEAAHEDPRDPNFSSYAFEPCLLESQIEFAMNQRCTQKYKTQYKSP